MCAKKNNYYETLTWIEEQIEQTNPFEANNYLIQYAISFELKLIKDNDITPTLFKYFMERIHNKAKTHYTNKLQHFLCDNIKQLAYQNHCS